MHAVTTLTAILALATLSEALVEHFLRPIIKPGSKPDSSTLPAADVLMRYGAGLVGILLCVIYNVDLLALVGLHSPLPFVGWIITGLIIGRGSNFLNDFADRWLGPLPKI
jgi:hypothetical protein